MAEQWEETFRQELVEAGEGNKSAATSSEAMGNIATPIIKAIKNGAEAPEQVQSDWNVTDTSSKAYIKNKPTIPTDYVTSAELTAEATARQAADTALDTRLTSAEGDIDTLQSEVSSLYNSEVTGTSDEIGVASSIVGKLKTFTVSLATAIKNKITTAYNHSQTTGNPHGTTIGDINGLQSELTEIESDVQAIEELIPSEASSSNQLADKSFVNSSISTATATFRGTSAAGLTEAQFLAWANGLTKDNNDYVFWNTTDSDGNVVFKRYKYDGSSWVYEYSLNNSSFTSVQWAAINSGITSSDVSDIGYNTQARHTHSNKSILDSTTASYTEAEKTKLFGIADGAEVNVQSDWSVTDTSDDAYIKNKPTIPTVDSALSSTSTNPVQNKVVQAALTANSTSDKLYANQLWGGPFKNQLSPMDTYLFMQRNCFLGAKASAIRVEYTNDGGTTWIDYGLTDSQKIALFSQFGGTNVFCGKANHVWTGCTNTAWASSIHDITNDNVALHRLRISICESSIANEGSSAATDRWIYCNMRRIGIYMSTQSASNGTHCVFETKSYADFSAGNDTWTSRGDYKIVGDTGWNSIPCENAGTNGYLRLGRISSEPAVYRFTIWSDALSSSPHWSQTGCLEIFKICGFSELLWVNGTTNDCMASYGMPCYVSPNTGVANFPKGITFAFRTFQTNLASSTAASFDGSANVTPGVTGQLADANIASAATWNAKQNALSAGTNITISGTTISAADTTYSEPTDSVLQDIVDMLS